MRISARTTNVRLTLALTSRTSWPYRNKQVEITIERATTIDLAHKLGVSEEVARDAITHSLDAKRMRGKRLIDFHDWHPTWDRPS